VKAADLASFDDTASAWVVAEGEYQFLVAASSQDVKATLPAKVKAQQTKVHDVMKPTEKLNLLKR
jgi:beta-glucosidase